MGWVGVHVERACACDVVATMCAVLFSEAQTCVAAGCGVGGVCSTVGGGVSVAGG